MPLIALPGEGEEAMTPRGFMDAVRETYRELLEHQRLVDPSLVGYPDFEAAMDHVEKHGIGPCESA